jgi:putative hydrolase of the HAD superfamily
LDLFGTLVNAPTRRERRTAADRLAAVTGATAAAIEDYFRSTWRVRHDGTLPTVCSLAEHLVREVGARGCTASAAAELLLDLGCDRLVPDESVVATLRLLRSQRIAIGVLSDAGAEVAACWTRSPLAPHVDAAVFSCLAGATKPDPTLYKSITRALGARPRLTVYCGDGGGDELRGARAAGMNVVRVERRGPADALAYGHIDWHGPTISHIEELPAYVTSIG